MLGHQKTKKDFESLIERDRMGHGYLFFGSRGVGKFSFASELARYLENETWPTEDVTRPLSDALFVIPDNKGTIGIDSIRSIKAFMSQRPIISKYRLVVIDSAEALTPEAQNALLKIAEEPPSSGVLILIAEQKDIILATLASRLQSLYFARVPTSYIADWLVTKGINKKEAATLAALVDGKPGMAITRARDGLNSGHASAMEFLSAGPNERKDFLKALLEPEEFSFKGFLDSLILILAEDAKRSSKLWHAVLELRRMADATGLNPSMQLRYLWTYL